jgi:hypothetical protein
MSGLARPNAMPVRLWASNRLALIFGSFDQAKE